jgi:hypothetical protein
MPPLGTRWEAIQQGRNVAEEERRRLGFGNAPLPDLVDVLEMQCVVLISLIHVSRLHICRELAGYDFVVTGSRPRRDRAEGPARHARSGGCGGHVSYRVDHGSGALGVFAELTTVPGRGEAACVVLAVAHGWSVLSDEKGRFRRVVEGRIGASRLMGTADVFVLAIRAGLVSISDADADKTLLDRWRFRMPFASFGELVR